MPQPDTVEDQREAWRRKDWAPSGPLPLPSQRSLLKEMSSRAAPGQAPNLRIWSETISLNPLWAGQCLPYCTGDTTQAGRRPGHKGVSLAENLVLQRSMMLTGTCWEVTELLSGWRLSKTPRLHIVTTEAKLLFDNF